MTEPEALEPEVPEEESGPEAEAGTEAARVREPASEQVPPESSPEEHPETSQPEVPGAEGDKTRSLAIAATTGVVLAATAFQNLWQQAGPLLDESRRTTGVLPLIILSGVAALVALAIVVLVARRLGRLLLSRRMTVSLLSALALICLLSLPFEQEGNRGLRGPASQHNEMDAGEVFAPLLGEQTGKRAGEKVMVLARTAGLTHVAGSWALYAVLGLLALSSLARLIWRRPVGAREFGFLAAHLGLLALLGGSVFATVFGHHEVGLRLGLDGTPRPIPGDEGDPAFSMVVREIVQEELPREYRVLGWMTGEQGPERLMLDGSRRGRTKWRGLDIEVLDFVPEAVAEEVIEDKGAQFNNPAVQIELHDGKKPRSITLYAYSQAPMTEPDLGVGFAFVRTATDAEALVAARRAIDGVSEKLVLVRPGKGKVDEVELDFGREKKGLSFLLPNVGVQLKVIEWYSGAYLDKAGLPRKALPHERFPAAIQVQPMGARRSPGEKLPPGFWILGGDRPRAPIGEVPAALKELQFLYNPARWQPLTVRIVEGPEGHFRLVELVDGKLAKMRSVSVGEVMSLEGGRSIKLVSFISGAQRSYRPVKSAGGEATEPAVQLAVTKGAVRETFWFFPERSGARGVFEARLLVRGVRRGLRREAIRVEVREKGSAPETVLLERGTPLRRGGYTVYLSRVNVTGRRKGRTLGLIDFVVSRKPGMWVVYLGMALMALGVPWLLWSRFRHVPDAVEDA